VGALLQAALGGSASDFNVIHIANRVFRFLVSCKKVGIFINQLEFFRCQCFEVFFNLWHDGGLNWRKEYMEFESQEKIRGRQLHTRSRAMLRLSRVKFCQDQTNQ
jgi:hypothetical protein